MEDQGEVRITLRLPSSLRDRLSAAADGNSRSMNGEIVARLDEFDALLSSSEAEKMKARETVAGLSNTYQQSLEAKDRVIEGLEKQISALERMSNILEKLNGMVQKVSLILFSLIDSADNLDDLKRITSEDKEIAALRASLERDSGATPRESFRAVREERGWLLKKVDKPDE